MSKNISKIPYGKNVYDSREIKAVVKTLKHSTQMGLAVTNFEKKVSKYFSKRYGLMVNSGSSALILAADAIYTFTNGSDVLIKNQTRIF